MKPLKLLAGPSALLLAVLAASSGAEVVERLVARVNGDIITQSEFEARQLAAVQAARLAPSEVEAYLRRNNTKILQEAIDDLLLVQRASELGIKLRPEYVQDVIEGIKKENNIASDDELRAQLRKEGMTLEELRRNIERSVLRRQVLAHDLEGKAQATEADARAYYESHQDEFTVSAGVRLSEVVVADEAAAREVFAAARGGADFAELARTRSTSPTATAGGDLGRLTPADIAPDLAKVVAALPPGGVSEPLRTGSGWRIVKVEGKEAAKTRPFAEVRADILKTLNAERGEKAYAEYIEGLRKANQPGIKLMANEVPLQVNLPPPGTPSVTAPKSAPEPAASAPAAPAVPALPGIDPSELSTSGSARPERVAPPAPAAPAPAPSPSPSARP